MQKIPRWFSAINVREGFVRLAIIACADFRFARTA